MKNKNVLYLTQAAVIAALYVVLTLIASALGLSSYAVQLRFSEALTILPYFTPAAIPGLFIGCIISNVFAGGILLDIVFGSIATLIGALGTYALRGYVDKGFSTQSSAAKPRFNARIIVLSLPPIIANTIIVPLVLKYGYGILGFAFNVLTVCLGEVISCGVLGVLLFLVLYARRREIF